MSFRISNSNRPVIQTDENGVNESKTETLSENSSSEPELSQIKSSAEHATARKAEQSLEALVRQSGLFNYQLPQTSATPDSVATMAVGEDGNSPIGQPSKATTKAVGEEDGGYQPNPKPGSATTLALGEEDGGYKPAPQKPGDLPTTPGGATTMAVGEEDGGYQPNPKPAGATTMAVGEEDGGLHQTRKPSNIVTMAVGEESAGK